MYAHGVCEGGGPLVLARRGAPVSMSTAVLWADLFYQAGQVTLLYGSVEGEGQEKTSVSSAVPPGAGRELEHVSSRRSSRRRRAGTRRRKKNQYCALSWTSRRHDGGLAHLSREKDLFALQIATFAE